MLVVEASIPKNWYQAGESIPIKLQMTPTGYKKAYSPFNEILLMKKVGWIKATLVNRFIIKGKPGEKEFVYDYGLSDIKFDDDTDFEPEKTTTSRTLNLEIPVISLQGNSNGRKHVDLYQLVYLTSNNTSRYLFYINH